MMMLSVRSHEDISREMAVLERFFFLLRVYKIFTEPGTTLQSCSSLKRKKRAKRTDITRKGK